jgi:hypothetical protein
LTEFGAKIQLGKQSTVFVPAGFPVVRPVIADVAAGLLAQPDTAARKDWATVLLGIDNIDLASLEGDADGSALLEVIWDAARGLVPETSLKLARRLATSHTQAH